jgi:hypothetical protein
LSLTDTIQKIVDMERNNNVPKVEL